MARPQSIDRDKLLDIAEKNVFQDGISALSFGSLAKSAKLSKATIQSVFVSRENLLELLLNRWVDRDEAYYSSCLGDHPTAEQRVKTHLEHIEDEPSSTGKTVCTMLATLSSSEKPSTVVQAWYRSRMNDFNITNQADRIYRIAYLAGEGLFLIKHLIRLEIADDKWAEIINDLQNLVDSAESSSRFLDLSEKEKT